MEKRNVYLFVTLLYTLQLIRESFIPTFKINDATISETIFLDDMLHDMVIPMGVNTNVSVM